MSQMRAAALPAGTEQLALVAAFRGHVYAYRCCAKLLMGAVWWDLMCVGTCGRHLVPSVVLQPLGHPTAGIRSHATRRPFPGPYCSCRHEVTPRDMKFAWLLGEHWRVIKPMGAFVTWQLLRAVRRSAERAAARRLSLPHHQAAPLNPLQSSSMADVRSSAA